MRTLPSFTRVQTGALYGLVFCLGLAAHSAQAQTEMLPAPPGEAAAPGVNAPASVPGVTPPETAGQAPEAQLAPTPVPTPATAVQPEGAAVAATAAVPAASAAVPAAPAAVPETPQTAAAISTHAEPRAIEAWPKSEAPSFGTQPVERTTLKPRVRGNASAPFSFGVGGGVVWNRDHAYDSTSTGGSTPQFDVMVSYDVLALTPRLIVSLGVGHRRGYAESAVYSITDNTLQAELLARFAGSSWLWPHARASVGAAFTRLEVPSIGDAGGLDANNSELATSFGGGLTLKTPTRAFENRSGHFASLSFGVLVEGGYTLAKAATFSGVPSGGTDDVERGKVRLGSLDRNAPYLRILLVTRF